ncbi:hypothetical protein BDF14DRAFT_259292 [Spinellus fusiger]|nr:hypothetical protein BDF14DRAFT_259292 [Spinellus fusiger]
MHANKKKRLTLYRAEWIAPLHYEDLTRDDFISIVNYIGHKTGSRKLWIPSKDIRNPLPSTLKNSIEEIYAAETSTSFAINIPSDDTSSYLQKTLQYQWDQMMIAHRYIFMPTQLNIETDTPSFRFLRPRNTTFKPTVSVRMLASEWIPGQPRSAPITIRDQYSDVPTKFLPLEDMFSTPKNIEKRQHSVAFLTSDIEELEDTDIFSSITSVNHSRNKQSILSSQPTLSTSKLHNSSEINWNESSSQPIPGAFSKRTTNAPKKKKKTQGFK